MAADDAYDPATLPCESRRVQDLCPCALELLAGASEVGRIAFSPYQVQGFGRQCGGQSGGCAAAPVQAGLWLRDAFLGQRARAAAPPGPTDQRRNEARNG